MRNYLFYLALSPAAPANWLPKWITMYCTSTSRMIAKECDILDSSLSLGRKFVSPKCNKSIRYSGGRLSHLLQWVHTWGEGEDGNAWHEKQPAKAAGHFSQLLDCNQPWGLHRSSYIIYIKVFTSFLVEGTKSPNLKFTKFQNTVQQIFLQYANLKINLIIYERYV